MFLTITRLTADLKEQILIYHQLNIIIYNCEGQGPCKRKWYPEWGVKWGAKEGFVVEMPITWRAIVWEGYLKQKRDGSEEATM